MLKNMFYLIFLTYVKKMSCNARFVIYFVKELRTLLSNKKKVRSTNIRLKLIILKGIIRS